MRPVEIFTLIFLALLAHSITSEYFTRFKKKSHSIKQLQPYTVPPSTTTMPITTNHHLPHDVSRQPYPGEGVFHGPKPTEPPPCFSKITDNTSLPDGVNHFPAYYEGENMLDSPTHYKEIITG